MKLDQIPEIIETKGWQEALSQLPMVEDADDALRAFARWNAEQVQHLLTDPRSSGSSWEDRCSAARQIGWDTLAESKTDTQYSAWIHQARQKPEWNAAWCATRELQPGNAGDAAWAATREAHRAIGTEAFRQLQEAELRRVCLAVAVV